MKKVILYALCLVISLENFGQTNSNFFNKKVSFGIVTALGQSSFNLKQNNWNASNLKDSFNSVNTQSGLILLIGNEVKVKLNNTVSFRQRFQINFEGTTLKYDTKKFGLQKIKLKNIVLAAPIHFIFQSNHNKYRPFIFFGLTPKINLGNNDQAIKEKIELKTFDISTDIGIGIEIKFSKFLLAPEVSFSQGMLNTNKNIGSIYSNTISSLKKQNIVLGIAIR